MDENDGRPVAGDRERGDGPISEPRDGLTSEPIPGPGEELPAVPPVPVSTVRPFRRWAIALLLAAAVVAVTSAIVLFVSASGSVGRLAGWVPAGTAIYAELRLEPPGDQGERVADLLGRFPGFADRTQLDAKITETLDRALGNASGGKVAYSSMKPWLGDSVAVAAKPAPTPGAMTGSVLLIVATRDAPKARQWLAANVKLEGSTAETYGGAQLTTGMADGMAWAYTVLDTVLLAGEKGAVESAIDTKGSSSFSASEPFRTAAASVEGDTLGFAFVDTKSVLRAAIASGVASGAASPIDNALVDRAPAWAVASLRARSDALEIDAAAPAVSGSRPSANRASTLAGRLPAGTIAVSEGRDIGTKLVAALDGLKADPKTADVARQIEGVLQTAGGVDATLGWIGDGAIVVTAGSGGSLSGGLVVATTDEKAAVEKVTQLRNLASLAGGAAGLTVTDEPYGDGTIIVVDLGDLRTLAGMAGAAAGGGAVPSVPSVPAGHVKLALTVQRGLFVLGSDDGFVKSVIDTKPGASLADQPRYRTAFDRAGTPNAGQVYLDIPGLAEAVVPLLPAGQRSRYESDLKPFLDPLGALAGSSLTGDPMRVRFVVTVK